MRILLVTEYHHVRGRLRVRFDRTADAEGLAARLRGSAGILSVTVRAVTGSLVIRYDPAILDAADLWALLPVAAPRAETPAGLPDAAGTPPWLEDVAATVAGSLAQALLNAALQRIAGKSAAMLIGALV